MRREEVCADSPAAGNGDQQKVWLGGCYGSEKQRWNHTKNGPIIHASSGLCIDVGSVQSGQDVLLKKCNGSPSQQWKWERYIELK